MTKKLGLKLTGAAAAVLALFTVPGASQAETTLTFVWHAGTCAEAFEMLALRMLESAEGRELTRSEILGLLRNKIDIVIQLTVVETVDRDGTISKARRITEIYHDPARKRAWDS